MSEGPWSFRVDCEGKKRFEYSRKGRQVTLVRGVLFHIKDLRRRVHWRLRELNLTLGDVAREMNMKRPNLSQLLIAKNMTDARFTRLSEILRMDEVDGWNRPLPKIPPKGKRRSLADAIQDRATDTVIESVEEKDNE